MHTGTARRSRLRSRTHRGGTTGEPLRNQITWMTATNRPVQTQRGGGESDTEPFNWQVEVRSLFLHRARGRGPRSKFNSSYRTCPTCTTAWRTQRGNTCRSTPPLLLLLRALAPQFPPPPLHRRPAACCASPPEPPPPRRGILPHSDSRECTRARLKQRATILQTLTPGHLALFTLVRSRFHADNVF